MFVKDLTKIFNFKQKVLSRFQSRFVIFCTSKYSHLEAVLEFGSTFTMYEFVGDGQAVPIIAKHPPRIVPVQADEFRSINDLRSLSIDSSEGLCEKLKNSSEIIAKFYVVYQGMFGCKAVEILNNESIEDLKARIPILSKTSWYGIQASNPKAAIQFAQPHLKCRILNIPIFRS